MKKIAYICSRECIKIRKMSMKIDRKMDFDSS